MKIIFLITLVALFFCLVFQKRNEDKKNITITSIFIIDILYCAHLLLAYILSLLEIKCDFITLSIINTSVIGILVFKSYYKYKKIEIQKYIINIKGYALPKYVNTFIASVVLLLIVFSIML